MSKFIIPVMAVASFFYVYRYNNWSFEKSDLSTLLTFLALLLGFLEFRDRANQYFREQARKREFRRQKAWAFHALNIHALTQRELLNRWGMVISPQSTHETGIHVTELQETSKGIIGRLLEKRRKKKARSEIIIPMKPSPSELQEILMGLVSDGVVEIIQKKIDKRELRYGLVVRVTGETDEQEDDYDWPKKTTRKKQLN